MILSLLLACTTTATDADEPPVDTGEAEDSGQVEDTELGTPPAAEVIELETSDGVKLVADYYGQTAPTPAVLLLHMIPPSYDRTSWPVDFIESLRAEGFSVLALDRRGAGDSRGSPVDAYDGPLGVLDAYAAVDYLLTQEATQIHLIGASNGTTTALDYAVEAESTDRPVPTSMAWMSPGTYTTAQHRVQELSMGRVAEFYPTAEANWSESAVEKADNGSSWQLTEYDPGDHGTLLFSSNPEVTSDLATWLRESR